MNKYYYHQYGSYYAGTLDNIEEFYPDNKKLQSKEGLSIQSQDRYPLRTAVDQRGEQTINRLEMDTE